MTEGEGTNRRVVNVGGYILAETEPGDVALNTQGTPTLWPAGAERQKEALEEAAQKAHDFLPEQ